MAVDGPWHSSGVSRANAICSERSRWSAVTLSTTFLLVYFLESHSPRKKDGTMTLVCQQISHVARSCGEACDLLSRAGRFKWTQTRDLC